MEINLDTSELSLLLEQLNEYLIDITKGHFRLDEKIERKLLAVQFRACNVSKNHRTSTSNRVTNPIVRRKFMKVASMNTNENTP